MRRMRAVLAEDPGVADYVLAKAGRPLFACLEVLSGSVKAIMPRQYAGLTIN
jgi:hypothetical protein